MLRSLLYFGSCCLRCPVRGTLEQPGLGGGSCSGAGRAPLGWGLGCFAAETSLCPRNRRYWDTCSRLSCGRSLVCVSVVLILFSSSFPLGCQSLSKHDCVSDVFIVTCAFQVLFQHCPWMKLVTSILASERLHWGAWPLHKRSGRGSGRRDYVICLTLLITQLLRPLHHSRV